MEETAVVVKKPRKMRKLIAEPVAVISPRHQRNLDMEKAFKQIAAYIKEQEQDASLHVEFYVDRKASVVVCRVEYPAKEIAENMFIQDVKYGVSRCMEGDKWNTMLGKYFALKYAKGTKIPLSIRKALGHASWEH